TMHRPVRPRDALLRGVLQQFITMRILGVLRPASQPRLPRGWSRQLMRGRNTKKPRRDGRWYGPPTQATALPSGAGARRWSEAGLRAMEGAVYWQAPRSTPPRSAR